MHNLYRTGNVVFDFRVFCVVPAHFIIDYKTKIYHWLCRSRATEYWIEKKNIWESSVRMLIADDTNSNWSECERYSDSFRRLMTKLHRNTENKINWKIYVALEQKNWKMNAHHGTIECYNSINSFKSQMEWTTKTIEEKLNVSSISGNQTLSI